MSGAHLNYKLMFKVLIKCYIIYHFSNEFPLGWNHGSMYIINILFIYNAKFSIWICNPFMTNWFSNIMSNKWIILGGYNIKIKKIEKLSIVSLSFDTLLTVHLSFFISMVPSYNWASYNRNIFLTFSIQNY